MKTTLDLPDDLLIEAKAVAARRRTTLKAIVEHALRREVQPSGPAADAAIDDRFERGPYGILRLKRNRGEKVTLETIRKIQDEIDQEELDRAINLARPR
jgi:hypothetical protein